MLTAMVSAELGDDVHREDPTVCELEAMSAAVTGKEAACFMPSGTMSNLATILTHCPRGSKVIVGEESDIYLYEAGGATVCGGVVYHPIPNRQDGTLDLEAIEAAFPPDSADPQFSRPALICLENPQNRCGGRVLPLSYLHEVSELARGRQIPLHIDGARIFNAALSAGVTADEIAAFADSVQFCLSKGLGAPVGSVVAGSDGFIRGVRRTRKMLGGGMRQSGILAGAGIVALRNRGRLAEDHALAARFAEGLAGIEGISVDTSAVETNMVFFRVTIPHLGNAGFLASARERGVSLAELGRGRIRSVIHYGVGPDDIDYALDVIRSILADEQASPGRVHAHDDSLV